MKELICIVGPRGCHLSVDDSTPEVTVTGNACPRGIVYGKKEVTAPERVVTSTVRIEGASLRRLPVKTQGDIPKGMMFDAVKLLDEVTVTAPVKVGDVIIPDILGTGVAFVAARSMDAVK